MAHVFDVVVVGAGPNGLAAAAMLAAHGRDVLVLEASSTIGGGARTMELTRPDYRHDVCSAIHPLGAASPVFEQLDLANSGRLEWIHAPIQAAHPLDGGGAALLYRSLDETAQRLGRDERRYRWLVGRSVRHWEQLRHIILGPIPAALRHPLLAIPFGALGLLPAALVARWFRTREGRALWAGMAAHSIASFAQPFTSAVALSLLAAGHTAGWPMAAGGSQAIADALADVVVGHGGEIRTGTRVTTWSDIPAATTVLFDTTPAQLIDIAGAEIPDRRRRALARFRPGPGSFKVDWALEGPVPWSNRDCGDAATVHVGGSYEEIAAAERMVMRGGHPNRPFVLVAQQSLFDASRTPDDGHTLWGYCHVPNGSTVDMTERIEAQIERFAPGFRELVVARHTMGPHDLEAHNANYLGGDIAGGATTVRQLLLRPRPALNPYRVTDTIWLCSASTPPGAGVHGMSGYHAAVRAYED